MMADKTHNNEEIAMTEMKMEMTLDEIIELSKKDAANRKNHRGSSNKARKNLKDKSYQPNSKAQNFLEFRSSIRHGALAKRRTNLQRNQFQVTTEVARKAAVAPPRSKGAGNWNKTRKSFFQMKAAIGDGFASGKKKVVPYQRQTLDARFAVMAVQRREQLPLQRIPSFGGGTRGPAVQLHHPRQDRTTAGFPVGSARRSNYFSR